MGICTTCGACCATFPVKFSRQELDSEAGGWVPSELSEIDADHGRWAHMRGTREHARRCVALLGTVGKNVSCSIYERRPGPCRAFAPAADQGNGIPPCGDARRLHDLPPLAGCYDAFPL